MVARKRKGRAMSTYGAITLTPVALAHLEKDDELPPLKNCGHEKSAADGIAGRLAPLVKGQLRWKPITVRMTSRYRSHAKAISRIEDSSNDPWIDRAKR